MASVKYVLFLMIILGSVEYKITLTYLYLYQQCQSLRKLRLDLMDGSNRAVSGIMEILYLV